MNQRLRELVTSGALGEVQQVDIELSIPSPPTAIHDGRRRWPVERRWISVVTYLMQLVSSVVGLIKHHQWSEPKPTYQLAALADTLQTGAEFLIDVDNSVANAELIDEVYRKAGLLPRG